MEPFILIRRAELTDLPEVTEIYNEAILTTTATFDTEPKTADERLDWFRRHDERHPVVVAILDGQVIGWASLGKWSDRRAYDDTAETSFYVKSEFRGRGIGRRLKEAIIAEARRLRFHTLVARVAEGSEASLHLNESCGFVRVGTLREVGRKFGRLLDVHILQKILDETRMRSNPMNDEELLHDFEDCSLPRDKWTHRCHVKIAYLFLRQFPFEEAVARMRTGIQRYNGAHSVVEGPTTGYSETTTRAFLQLISAAIHACEDTLPTFTAESFCEAHPQLMTKKALRFFYSPAVLKSPAAKTYFLEPDLAPLPRSPVTPARLNEVTNADDDCQADIIQIASLDEAQTRQLKELFEREWWSRQRSIEEVREMLTNSSVVVAFAEKDGGRLIAFCRVVTDFVFQGTLYDVVVAEDWRGRGLGRMLMDVLLRHPRLARVRSIWLRCHRSLEPFYAKWGFTLLNDDANWMRKVVGRLPK